jgi:hypothetical protein
MRDGRGQLLALATPAPCPPDRVLFSGAAYAGGSRGPLPGEFGLYHASQNWGDSSQPAEPTLLFDDPALVDAEPVAVYARKVIVPPPLRELEITTKQLTLASGREYNGPVGNFRADYLYTASVNDLPGQVTDAGQRPIFGPSAPGTVAEIRIYASHRDRFDDPDRPRIPGGWELLRRFPVSPEGLVKGGDLPTGSPTVLAGFDREGKIAQWQTAARDRQGRTARLVGLAGDHYSGVVAGGFHFCSGCHTGHSALSSNDHAEKLGP